jgi:glucosamine kinase
MAQHEICPTNAEESRHSWPVSAEFLTGREARTGRGRRLYIGVDGGGSGCRARLADAGGRPLGEGAGPPAALRFGVQRSMAALRIACEAAVAKVGLPPDILADSDAVVGLAGIGRKNLFDILASQPHPFRSVRYVNDATIACIGANAGQHGGVIIVGTGSVALGLTRDGEIRLGGYGFPISDEGSGAALGLSAIRASLRAHDGLTSPSRMTTELLQRFHNDPFEIVAWSDEATATDYATLAPLVIRHAEANDFHALAIVRHGAARIDELVNRLAKGGVRRICLLGGLAQKMTPFIAPDAQAMLSPALGDALDGALLLARHAIEEPALLSENS